MRVGADMLVGVTNQLAVNGVGPYLQAEHRLDVLPPLGNCRAHDRREGNGMSEPIGDLVARRRAEQVSELVGRTGDQGAFCGRDHGTDVESGRLQSGERRAFTGAVNPYRSLEEPTVGDRGGFPAHRPGLEGQVEGASNLGLAVTMDERQNQIDVAGGESLAGSRDHRPVK